MLARSLLSAALVAAVAVSAAPPAAADWLVLREGGAVETEGGWTVKGKLVVFHRVGGSLASMRLDQVDLEASERRTARALAPAEPVAKQQPKVEVKPVLVLTDADVKHVARPSSRASDGNGASDVAESAADVESREDNEGQVPLRVSAWSRVDDMAFTGIKIGGTVTNESQDLALNPTLTIRLTDDQGRVIGRSRAVIASKALEAGAAADFVAEFPGVYGYSGIEFEPRSFHALRGRASAAASSSEADPSDAAVDQ